MKIPIEKAEELLTKYLKSTLDIDGDISVTIVKKIRSIVDLGIVIALEEEFGEFFPQINAKPDFNDEIQQYYYYFERESILQTKYRCIATFIGGMGIGKAALITDRLISEYHPKTVVNIGIAGAMDKDIAAGDVIVADQSDDYLAVSKAIDSNSGDGFEFRLSGNPYKSTLSHVNHAKNLKFAHPIAFANWLENCQANLNTLLKGKIRYKLLASELVRESPLIFTGSIASGQTVATSKAFTSWLKRVRDRKFLAIEMESAGFLTAAHGREIETLIIRGISDFSDDRKSDFDGLENGALRQYSMRNAIALLWAFLDSDLIKLSEGTRRPHDSDIVINNGS